MDYFVAYQLRNPPVYSDFRHLTPIKKYTHKKVLKMAYLGAVAVSIEMQPLIAKSSVKL
jgi:hypothetical protein